MLNHSFKIKEKNVILWEGWEAAVTYPSESEPLSLIHYKVLPNNDSYLCIDTRLLFLFILVFISTQKRKRIQSNMFQMA